MEARCVRQRAISIETIAKHRPIILWVKGQLCVRMMNDFLHDAAKFPLELGGSGVVETEVFRMDGNVELIKHSTESYFDNLIRDLFIVVQYSYSNILNNIQSPFMHLFEDIFFLFEKLKVLLRLN